MAVVVRQVARRPSRRIHQGWIRVGLRELAYLSVGAADGDLILHNHGGPSSRLEAHLLDSAALANGIRLVCVDRPGQGKSDPQLDRSFASWAGDLEVIADAFEAEHFGVTGWSEGGPWALAAAAYIPAERLVHVSSIAAGSYGSVGSSWPAAFADPADTLGGRVALHFDPDFTLMYDLLGLTQQTFTKRFRDEFWQSACPADRAFLDDHHLQDQFMSAAHECFRQGVDGLVLDAKLLHEPWPFNIEHITRPVHFWQGSDDCLVSEAINRKVASRMPAGVWHEVDGAGHFIAVTAASDILGLAAKDFVQEEH